MTHFAGLDVSVNETSICIVDDEGRTVLEAKVVTEPAAIISALASRGYVYRRIGLEAGPLSQWLYGASAEAGLPVICVETRHMKAALSAQTNKTDRNDARGIAQMMRVGLYRPVHVKTLQSQERRMLLTSRKLRQSKLLDIENELRGTLKNFGLKVGSVSKEQFEARIGELVEPHRWLAAIVEPILVVRTTLRAQTAVLHKMLLGVVRDDPVCQRFLSVPGVGAVVAMTYRATIDVPCPFRQVAISGGGLWLDPAQVPIRRDRLDGAHLEVRRRDVAGCALRGGAGAHDAKRPVVGPEGLGHASRSPPWPTEGACRCRAPARGHSAPHVGRRDRVSLGPQARA